MTEQLVRQVAALIDRLSYEDRVAVLADLDESELQDLDDRIVRALRAGCRSTTGRRQATIEP